MVASYKAKFVLTMRPGNCTFGYLPQRNENVCSRKSLFTNVHNRFIPIS